MKYNIDTEKFMDYKCTALWIFTSQTHLCIQHPDQENRILPAPQGVPSGSLPATTSHSWGCNFIQHFYFEIIIDSEEVGRRDVQGGPVNLSPNFLQRQYFCTTIAQLEKEMASHSSVLAWRISWTGEPGGLPSMGLQSRTRVKRLSSSIAQYPEKAIATHCSTLAWKIPRAGAW